MIAEARAALLAVLETAGLPAYAQVPDKTQPPMAVMVPSAAWIENGETFGEFTISFDVQIVVDIGTNQAMSIALDAAVEDVLVAIAAAPAMYAAEVEQPSAVDIGTGNIYLGTTITVRQHLQL